MIRITLERKALNANARPTENELQNFEFHFKSLFQKEFNAKRSSLFVQLSQLCLVLCPIGLCFLILMYISFLLPVSSSEFQQAKTFRFTTISDI
ncbi:hypothetical protein T12_1870 [Trichinella patagoniensis]|uniref:Uncharacterized protein n=1 Tax=Trichinella patagoniensis TaxID=990121 RepID=A0A0V0ZUN8_9BILA|nr:hypothetical protein T12_1870 [Trichinella patagoniensis]